VLVFGGSQGARAVNEAMVAALAHMSAQKGVLFITHQTGEADFEKVRTGYEAAGWAEHAHVRRYIDDMVAAFASSDLVICRAGATTSAELVAAGKAAIMVPFPFAADDHQRKNAEALQEAGAARMILQQELTGERLARELTRLVQSPGELTRMEEMSRRLARGDAAKATVDLMEKMVKNTEHRTQNSE
jgi:UDP-N-acetylglucosamine--N-acetylmuramyl-(pentapeptide) pyrophosphoryl-undecaprenol N-acetylglucosamine transferase